MQFDAARKGMPQVFDSPVEQLAVVRVKGRTPDALREARQGHSSNRQAIIGHRPMSQRSMGWDTRDLFFAQDPVSPGRNFCGLI
jgi:hypothetical protein